MVDLDSLDTMPLTGLLEEFVTQDATLDLNCNVVKNTTQDTTNIPVIDLSSDDEDSGLELGSCQETNNQNFDVDLSSPVKETSPQCSPLSHNLEPPVSVSCHSVKKTDVSINVSSPNASFSLNSLPSVSELSSLGVKNVLASYLNYKPSAELPTTTSENELSLSTSTESYIDLELSKTEELEILQEFKFPCADEHSLSSLDSGITVPSPETEAILLEESEQLKPYELSSGCFSTCASFLDYNKCHKVATLEAEHLESDVPNSVTSDVEELGTASAPTCETSDSAFVPSPPACQLLEKADKDCPVVLSGSEVTHLPAASSLQSLDEEVQIERIVTAQAKSFVEDTTESAEDLLSNGDFILDEVLPLLLEAEAACSVDADPVIENVNDTEPVEEDTDTLILDSSYNITLIPDNSFDTDLTIQDHSAPTSVDTSADTSTDASTETSTETAPEGTQPKPSWAVPWISTDDAENADNNDPEWDLMRKLETDEERYRVVREQWRQMTIPDPRRNLTCHNFRRISSRRATTNNATQGQSKKRARSHDDCSDVDHPSKRRRTYSCVQMFENKINSLHQQLNKNLEGVHAEHERKLFALSDRQLQQQQSLMNSTAPHHIVRRQIDDLAYRQEKEVDGLQAEFNEEVHHVKRDTMQTINILQNASQEVLAFNQFYTNLGDSDDNDHCNISEEELQQFEEMEQMFEAFDQIYTG
ncbi:uncharacterized protein LOC117639957 [Thrips palmi]|uniref:Uncharacterized protein LOC117639957 n=1 Tax=Thrips palmi TaxID=161013 RepID=A0A6P8YDS8_THRPL|nr:uncharacterized protein LOC117639957 [Thrips palmi]